jgi:hypothetical protein
MISTIVGTFGAREDSTKDLNRGLKLSRRHSHHILHARLIEIHQHVPARIDIDA